MSAFDAVKELSLQIMNGFIALLNRINLGGFTWFDACIVFMVIGIVVSVFVRSGKA